MTGEDFAKLIEAFGLPGAIVAVLFMFLRLYGPPALPVAQAKDMDGVSRKDLMDEMNALGKKLDALSDAFVDHRARMETEILNLKGRK